MLLNDLSLVAYHYLSNGWVLSFVTTRDTVKKKLHSLLAGTRSVSGKLEGFARRMNITVALILGARLQGW